jgi:hypothetical protein
LENITNIFLSCGTYRKKKKEENENLTLPLKEEN